MAKKNKSGAAVQETGAAVSDLMDETSSPALVAPTDTGAHQLPAVAAPNVGQLLADRSRVAVELGDMFEAEHVGGSLPLIKWTREGQSFVGIFAARDERTEERDFPCLVFDVIDTRKLRETRDVKKSVAVRAQLVSSSALEPYFSRKNAQGELIALGQLVQLTYVGEIETKRGQSKLKLITVEQLKLKGVAGAAV